MSEDKSKPASTSGIMPEDEAPRPTVIGRVPHQSPVAFKPTVIGTPVKPTTDLPKQDSVKPAVKPTVISGSGPSTKQSIPIAPIPVVPKVTTPSVITGTIRKGLEVTVEELKKRFPGESVLLLEKVVAILAGTVVETLTVVQCNALGQAVQREYSDLVGQSLTLVQDAVFQDSPRHLGRLYSLLEEIAQGFQPQKRFWQKSKTPFEELAEHKTELDQLRQILDSALPHLDRVRLGLEEVSAKMRLLASRVEAESLAAQYLADILEQKMETQKAQAAIMQSMNLTKVIANINDGIVLRAGSIQQLESLSSKIRDTVLSTLPSWIEKVSLVSKRPQTETDLYDLRRGIGDIVSSLR